MTKIILKCENISYETIDESIFSNQKKVILKNISFDVYENEILSIAGESGSGKTTLGKILSGILKPNSGEIKYFFNQNNYDKDISAVQFLFQNNGELINPFRSVGSILNEAIRKAGKNAFVKSVDEILKIFSLPKSIKTQKGYTLSGGQQQRVAFARILAVNPQLIILDEPFSAQDKESVDNLVSLIKKIRNDSDRTIICISHDIKVLNKLSDRLMIMKDGKVVEIGNTRTIFSNPQNEFTKFLIKASELELTAEEVRVLLKKYEKN